MLSDKLKSLVFILKEKKSNAVVANIYDKNKSSIHHVIFITIILFHYLLFIKITLVWHKAKSIKHLVKIKLTNNNQFASRQFLLSNRHKKKLG